MPARSQTLSNHARYVPLFHFVLLAILVLYLAWTVRHVIQVPSAQHWVDLMMAIAYGIFFVYVRRFPLTVQDRVIRLEETLRLQRLAPDLAARAAAFTCDQWIGLRFACDEELPALARRVLDEQLTDRNAIKRLVRSWRPDYLRV
jgi:Family of unknown function (DUF6526)